MATSLSSSNLQIIPMPTKSGGVQVNQMMTLMTSDNDKQLHENTNDANTNCVIFNKDVSH
jgi:hypothetical protein